MRVIEQKMLDAIQSGENLKLANTRIEHVERINGFSDDHVVKRRTNVYLHDNHIAQITDKEVWISHCGWITKTTVARINVVLREFTKSTAFISHGRFFVRTPHKHEFISSAYLQLTDDKQASLTLPRIEVEQ